MSRKLDTTDAKEEAKPALVPKLRFPEFRGTDEWTQSELGRNATILKGKGITKADIDPNGSQLCIRYGELYTRYGETISEAVSRTNLPASELFLSQPGDVIIPSSGETKIDIAKASCVLGGGIALGGDLNVIRSKLNGTFLSYFLNGPKRFDIAKVAQGDTVVHLYPHQIEALKISIPTPTEQQKIAECLSSVDEVIAAQARKLDALKTHKKGLMERLFPREGETQPRLRFPEFLNTGAWEEMQLSHLIDSLDAGVSVNSGDRPANSSEVGVLKTSAVTNGIFEPQENKVVFDEAEIGRVKEPVLADTIIISRMNTPALVGANAYVEKSIENIFLPDRLWAAKAKPGTSMRFVAFILGSAKGRAALSKLAKGSSGTMKNITKPEVLAFLTMAPLPPEQHRIAECLSSLDALIAAESQKHAALQRHKRGLMQQLFPSSEDIS